MTDENMRGMCHADLVAALKQTQRDLDRERIMVAEYRREADRLNAVCDSMRTLAPAAFVRATTEAIIDAKMRAARVADRPRR